jgi:type I restriction-modification system DNA methylase subunit
MAVEKYSENLVLAEMKCQLGDNGWGFVYPQGDVGNMNKIDTLLKKAGGKPKSCALSDFSQGGAGKAKPEYIITFKDDIHTIIVVECKNTVSKHRSKKLDCPNAYAVDGVLYYAKFLKEKYNVIAVAVSGTTIENMKVDAFHWLRAQDEYLPINKAKDVILEPKNYVKLIKGENLQKDYSLDEIRTTAIEMHEYLREIKVVEAHKPIFIAGILIALNDKDFANNYSNLTSFKTVMDNIQAAIKSELDKSNIKNDRAAYINQVFATLKSNTKFSAIPLGEKKSIMWYIEQLEVQIKPMMDSSDSTIDALGVFYHEFIKYSGGDGSGLGIVLTPQHLTEFMCDIAGVNKNSTVVDICCGSASFLVTAMSKMFKGANPKEMNIIRQKRLYGVEFDDGLYTLAIANMIIRQDGKSNIYKGDCFDVNIVQGLKEKNINIGLINPPYSQKDKSELEFVEQLLNILCVGGVGTVVVPMSCAIGTKFGEIRERLFKKHTLKAVFSMPDDIFYPTATNSCVMVWEAHKPHDSTKQTFFGYCKDDGFVKAKKLGRIDKFDRWEKIKNEWLDLYQNLEVKNGLSAKKTVSWQDEWLCEAYMETDFSKLTQTDFKQTVNNFLAYDVKSNNWDFMDKYIMNITNESKITTKIKHKDIPFNVKSWKKFKMDDIFIFHKGKRLTKEDMVDGDINFIGAIDDNNGIRQKIDLPPTHMGNCITVNYNGSVGEAFYQSKPFLASDDVNILYPKNWVLNPYVGLFLCTIIRANKYRFGYGRKWKLERMRETIIALPIDRKGTPDWQYMENYIKSLPYSDLI